MTTILLADDHDDILGMMTKQLQKHGYTVVTANNGLEAVLATAQTAPSLILMDVKMPELDGLDATEQIRAANVENRIPIIALTAYALPGDESRAMAAGWDAFHTKPVDFERLFDQISKLLGETTADSEAVPS